MNWDLSDKIGGLFIFYLLLACNYLDNIFGCSTRKVLESNRFLQHAIGFLSLFFFVSVVSGDGSTPNPFDIIPIAFVLYIFFVFSTRCEHSYLSILVMLSFALYFINLYQQYYFEKIGKDVPVESNPYQNFLPTPEEIKNLFIFEKVSVEEESSASRSKSIMTFQGYAVSPGSYLLSKRSVVFIYIAMLIVLAIGMYFYYKQEAPVYKPPKGIHKKFLYTLSFMSQYWFGTEDCSKKLARHSQKVSLKDEAKDISKKIIKNTPLKI